eukprot:scaffold4321_cov33-Tisochrysis_lutea.AAC.4
MQRRSHHWGLDVHVVRRPCFAGEPLAARAGVLLVRGPRGARDPCTYKAWRLEHGRCGEHLCAKGEHLCLRVRNKRVQPRDCCKSSETIVGRTVAHKYMDDGRVRDVPGTQERRKGMYLTKIGMGLDEV